MNIHLASDFERWQEFRQLVKEAGSEERAMFLWVRLWVELAQLVQSTERLGFFPQEAEALFVDTLGDAGVDFKLLTSGTFALLKPVEGGWECPLFMRENGHLRPGARSMQSSGGHLRSFVLAQKKAERSLEHQVLLLPDELFVRPDGGAMDAEQTRRVTMIIRTVDNALKLPPRTGSQFTRGLVQDAWRVHEAMTDAQIMAAAKTVVLNREHPGVPKSTEQLLPLLREIAAKIGR